jgi:2-acylglycerol O-acyltransferase 2
MPNEKGTIVYAFQKRFQALFGFTLPLFHGRGILNYNVGLLPYRRRIVSVSACALCFLVLCGRC